LLTNPIDPEVTESLARQVRLTVLADPTPDAVRQAAREADLIIVRAPLPDDVFEQGPRLLGAIRHGAGVDMIPVERASAAGVIVANAPGANAQTVAEFVLAQLLQLARRTGRIDATLRAQGWAQARAIADSGCDLGGRTLGIVGVGAIGSALARMAGAGLSMRVLGQRRSDGPMPQGVQRTSLPELLAQSDYVVLTCPLTSETRGLMGAAQFAQMKPGACIVNVSRGPVIDESALIAALRRGHLAGAALDVFEAQPLAADSPLRDFPDVLLTPHQAGIDRDSMQRMGHSVAAQAIEILSGRQPKHFVNPQVWPARRANPFHSNH
jgi:D-3-phosphoglycerate dehydrogenase